MVFRAVPDHAVVNKMARALEKNPKRYSHFIEVYVEEAVARVRLREVSYGSIENEHDWRGLLELNSEEREFCKWF